MAAGRATQLTVSGTPLVLNPSPPTNAGQFEFTLKTFGINRGASGIIATFENIIHQGAPFIAI